MFKIVLLWINIIWYGDFLWFLVGMFLDMLYCCFKLVFLNIFKLFKMLVILYWIFIMSFNLRIGDYMIFFLIMYELDLLVIRVK